MLSTERRHRFGRHDRIAIRGAYYRCETKHRDTHVLQRISDGIIQDDRLLRTDAQINDLMRRGHLRVDQDYYSKASAILRMAHDDVDIFDLRDDQLRTISWKAEWVERFHRATANIEASWRPTRSLDDIRRFVEQTKDAMDRWYLERFGERRRPGRRRAGEERKAFDWPGASTLYGWISDYEDAGCQLRAFRPGYEKCGNRNQLDPRVVEIIDKQVRNHAGSNRPSKQTVIELVNGRLGAENLTRPSRNALKVSDRAIRRRIALVDPLLSDFGRHGADYVLSKRAPIGKGQRIYAPLERIEMDDWEMDLFVLLSKSEHWKKLSEKQKKLTPRVRCTLTIAVDCATRCVVGFNLSPLAPSTPGSRGALRSMMVDKNALAAEAGCRKDWPMHGKPVHVVTDGGPVFKGEFDDAIRSSLIGRRRPNQDKRMRGYIESFFKTFKRVCELFAGRAFANVVERGDYQAEAMASLTFEELRRAIVRFIVDVYHMRGHRGLERRAPYDVWQAANRDGLDLPPDANSLRMAFGLRGEYVIDAHGITIGRFSYNSTALALLGALMRGTKIATFQDPYDLGVITVKVPARLRERFSRCLAEKRVDTELDPNGTFEVPSMDDLAVGLTLDMAMAGDRRLEEYVREREAANAPVRYAAMLALAGLAERARERAALPTFVPTQDEYDAIVGVWKQMGQAALSTVEHAAEPIDPDDGDIGSIVAVSRRTRPVARRAQAGTEAGGRNAPFGGSMNMDEDDYE